MESDPRPDPAPARPPRRWRPARARADWRSRLRWFASEFLVVVSGVLVALMLNAWWAGRQAAAAEAQTLDRLFEESEAVVRYLRDDVALRDSLLGAHEAAVAALTPGAAAAPDLETFRVGIFFAFIFTPVNPPRSVYDEVTGAGGFGDLSSVEVRSAISAYYARLDELQGRLVNFRQVAQPGLEMMAAYPFAYDPDAPYRMRVVAEPAAMRGDRRAYNLLVFGLRNQLVFHRWRKDALDHAVAMCEALAAATGRACEGAVAGPGAPPRR